MAEIKSRFTIEDNISEKLLKIIKNIDTLLININKLSVSIDKLAVSGSNYFNKLQNNINKNYTKIASVSNTTREKLLSDINAINNIPLKDKILNVKSNIGNIPFMGAIPDYNNVMVNPNKTPLTFNIPTPNLTQHQSIINKVSGIYKKGVNNIYSFMSKISNIYFGARALLDSANLFFKTSDKVVNIDAKLNLITGNKQAKEELNNSLKSISSKLGVNYLDFSDNAIKMKMLTAETFKSNQELVRFNELMQKMFRLSGSTTEESKSAMLQLTQALAANKLQGDEYRSMLRNAPLLIEAITKQMGVPRSELKRLSSEGKLTAEVIKQALFSMADELDIKFNKLPKQWGQIGNIIKNKLIISLQPILLYLNKLANSTLFFSTINAVGSLLSGIGGILMVIADGISYIFNILQPILPLLKGILYLVSGVGVAYGVTLGLMKGYAIWQGIITTSTTAWTVAQALLNGQLAIANSILKSMGIGTLLTPLGLIVLVIVGIIGVIKILQTVLNKFYNMNISFLGTTIGLITLLGAIVYNTVAFIINICRVGFQYIWNGAMVLCNAISSMIKVIFNGIGEFISKTVSMALKGISWLVSKVDNVIGTNYGAKIGNFADKLWNKQGNYNAVNTFTNKFSFKAEKLPYFGLKNSFKYGANIGNGISNKYFGNNSNTSLNIAEQLKNINGTNKYLGGANGNKLNDIANNTNRMANSQEEWQEDLKLLKDIAHRDVINSVTSPTIEVTINAENNINNQNSNDFTIDSIIHDITSKLADEVQNSLLGVVNR